MILPENSSRFWDSKELSHERLLTVLPIAHKYCMAKIEEAIIKNLKITVDYVCLMVASQIVDSKPLYGEAVIGLRQAREKPNLEQAIRIGVRASFAVMDECSSKCRSCRHSPMNLRCPNCSAIQ